MALQGSNLLHLLSLVAFGEKREQLKRRNFLLGGTALGMMTAARNRSKGNDARRNDRGFRLR
jgi:hypothetical protein